MSESALLRAFPGLSSLPREPCAELPTPVQAAPDLAEAWGIESLWIKRDDLTGTLYGGNKVRKLSYLLAQARQLGCESLLTAGAIGSHHCLATTLYGRRAGFKVEAALFPQPITEHVRANLAANLRAGVQARPLRSPLQVPFALARRRFDQRCFVIPGGGSSARGVIGYVEAGFELAEQVRAGELPEPVLAVVALGTGGTAAGLALGLRLAGLRTKVLAVRVIQRIIGNARTVARLANAAQKELHRFDPTLPWVALGRVEVEHGQFGSGYGHPTPAAADARAQSQALAGIELETTYTAKALAALAARAGLLPAGPVLFWNTFSSVRPGDDPRGSQLLQLLPPGWRRIWGLD